MVDPPTSEQNTGLEPPPEPGHPTTPQPTGALPQWLKFYEDMACSTCVGKWITSIVWSLLPLVVIAVIGYAMFVVATQAPSALPWVLGATGLSGSALGAVSMVKRRRN